MTHTPGPWNWNGHCLVAEPTADYPNGYGVAKVFNESDVALIAAAPAMLKALQRITHPMADDDDLAHALEVIRQATGS